MEFFIIKESINLSFAFRKSSKSNSLIYPDRQAMIKNKTNTVSKTKVLKSVELFF